MEKIRIRESVVVEGRDDEAAVRAAADCDIICTHGYGITKETLTLIKTAYEKNGVIIFTDPDHAGLSIRNKLKEKFPEAKDAYLSQEQATKKDDIGIENAKPEDIARALTAVASGHDGNAGAQLGESDMAELGLSGASDSADKRAKLGAALGIGYANAKTFLKRLNYLGIEHDTIVDIMSQMNK